MEPIVNRLKKEYAPRLRAFQILNIRTIEGKEGIERYGIEYTPTFLILDAQDKELDRHVGKADEAFFKKFIEDRQKEKMMMKKDLIRQDS